MKTLAATAVLGLILTACGREPSNLLRQGQLPFNDFPLYVTDGSNGLLLKFDNARNKTTVLSGLNNPAGVATDRWGNVFVVESGANRVLKVNGSNGNYIVLRDNLASPSVIAVDSFGEAYISQDTPHNVIRARDGAVVASFFQQPAGLVAGVSDLLVIADINQTDSTKSLIYWGPTTASPTATVNTPVNVAVDGMGRIYVAEGIFTGARVLRYHQSESGGDPTVVANQLSSPQGIAIDTAQNIYIVEKGNLRITLVTQDQQLYQWYGPLGDPQYIAFTQY